MTKVAFMYDFDKTLCDKDMQEYGFIPNMKLSSNEFWAETTDLTKDNSMEKILAYMYQMIKCSKSNNIPLTREYLNGCGNSVKFFDGVLDWFTRINNYGYSLGLEVEHYIISSGLKEIINGTPIAKFFKEIYSCEFHYNDEGVADFPGFVVNYTMKTQFLYRINKGALDPNDEVSLNKYIDENSRRIKMTHMLYFGDGLTDIPCMKLVKNNGGYSIAVYQDGNDKIAKTLINDGRCNFIAKADYSENKDIENIVKSILVKLSYDDRLAEIHNNQINK